MSYPSLSAYEGSENYIFVSYAHKDTDKVFPIMSALNRAGYRIWYDEGIAPGSEWPEDIATHLNSSAMVIAFISPHSMASVNCRREINFALSKQKPFLSVVLEPTEMPLGMELQLSTQQSVLRYNYRTEEQFIEKICACPDLVRCKEPQKQPIAAAVVNPVAQMPSDQTPAAVPNADPVQPQKSKVPIRLLGIAAGALVLMAALLFFLFASPWDSAPENPSGSMDSPAGQTQNAQTAPAETNAETLTVYVNLPESVPSACLSAWSSPSGKEAFDTWPGIPLQKGADGWYTATVPAWANRVSIVSNDGMHESQHITLQWMDAWIVMREDWTCQTSYNGPFVATVKIHARFESWTDPYCWAWSADADAFDQWPGEPFEKSGEWYIIEIPCDTIGIKLSDKATGYETQDISVAPGADIWYIDRNGHYAWFYEEPTEEQLNSAFN